MMVMVEGRVFGDLIGLITCICVDRSSRSFKFVHHFIARNHAVSLYGTYRNKGIEEDDEEEVNEIKLNWKVK